jgi:leader peptidase (prepilin peptidase)/N-methyltransferase
VTPLAVALGLAGAVVGAGVAWTLRRWDYRLDDERNLPVRRPMPWLVPAMALAWGLLGWRLGELGQPGLLPAYLFFGTLSGALVAIDLDVHRLPDALQLPAMPVLVVLLAIASWASGDWWALVRAVIAWAVLLVAYFVLVLISPGAQGLGLGDVKLAGVLGLVLGWLGWFPLLIGVYAGFLVGGLFALALVLGRRAGWSSSVAYGPPMIVGAFVGILLPVEVVADLLFR